MALTGERGREAQHWIARRNERTTVVCATSDRPAPERVLAAHVAVAHAQALRERGLDVLLVLDSLARFAAASREIAVASGESAGRGGFPPSVFAELARLVEVAGAVRDGSITLIATVLSDGDDRDPVSEAARSILDGHIALSVALAQAGRFPAVDVLGSTSRTMDMVASEPHLRDARALRHTLSLTRSDQRRAQLGYRARGGAARAAIAIESQIGNFLAAGPAQMRSRCDVVATRAAYRTRGVLEWRSLTSWRPSPAGWREISSGPAINATAFNGLVASTLCAIERRRFGGGGTNAARGDRARHQSQRAPIITSIPR